MAQEAPPAGPPSETRLARGRRYTHRTALYAAVVIFVLAAIYLILLIAQNTRHVPLSYGFGTTRQPLLWIVVVAGLVGWVLGIATSVILRRRTRRPH